MVARAIDIVSVGQLVLALCLQNVMSRTMKNTNYETLCNSPLTICASCWPGSEVSLGPGADLGLQIGPYRGLKQTGKR